MTIRRKLISLEFLDIKRRFFYQRNIIQIALYVMSVYLIWVLISGAIILKHTMDSHGIHIDLLSFKVIIIISSIDFLYKLIFNRIKITNVLPYLRLKISRNTLVTFLLFKNLFGFINILSYIFVLPLVIISSYNQFLNELFLLLGTYLLTFSLNNYISIFIEIYKMEYKFKDLIPLIILVLIVLSNYSLQHHFESSASLYIIRFLYILQILIMILFSHQIIKPRIMRMFYLD